MSLIRERCANHPDRDASFRCFHCTHYYCRECASTWQNRLVCTDCLLRLETKPEARRRVRIPTAWLAMLVGLAVLWTTYFALGRLLVEIPSDVHDGGMWENLVE